MKRIHASTEAGILVATFLAWPLPEPCLGQLQAPAIKPSATFQHQAAYPGKSVSFTVSATGLAPLIYQWRMDGRDLVGQTNKTLALPAVQVADGGDYSVVVANPDGSTVSPPVRLWVVPPASEFQRFDYTNAAMARLPYFILFPSGYDSARKYPLALWIHGGCTWDEATLPADLWNWPVMGTFLAYARQIHDPAILVLPTHRRGAGGCGWAPQEIALVAELVERLVTELPVDEDRVYLNSLSSGLEGTVGLLRLRPNRFAAALLSAGEAVAHRSFTDLPVWTAETRQDGASLGAFARQLRAFGGHAIHTEFSSASHSETWIAQIMASEVLEWFFAQRRGWPSLGSPALAIHQPDTAELRRTGAATVSLTGSMNSGGRALIGLTWTNLTGRTGSTIPVSTSWDAGSLPLVPEKTNIIIVTATMPATFIPGQTATTTFSDTLSIFSTPVWLSLTRQAHNVLLDWTGGVPPFAIQSAPTGDAAAWNEVFSNVSPPVAVPASGPMQFYRVTGQ